MHSILYHFYQLSYTDAIETVYPEYPFHTYFSSYTLEREQIDLYEDIVNQRNKLLMQNNIIKELKIYEWTDWIRGILSYTII